MLGPVRRFLSKVGDQAKDAEPFQIEIIEPRATDISQIEVEPSQESLKRRLSRERRREVLQLSHAV